MGESDQLAQRFEQNRGHLRALAYRMLGSLSEADDAVQEAWLRLNRSDSSGIENLGGWADDGRCPRLPGHVALAQFAPRGISQRASIQFRRAPQCRKRSLAGSAAGRFGRCRASRGA
jgi:hypothetical protein